MLYAEQADFFALIAAEEVLYAEQVDFFWPYCRRREAVSSPF